MATAFALNHLVVVTSSPPGLTAVLVPLRALPALLMTRLLGARESQKPTLQRALACGHCSVRSRTTCEISMTSPMCTDLRVCGDQGVSDRALELLHRVAAHVHERLVGRSDWR